MRPARLAGALGIALALRFADTANALTITAAKVTDRGVIHIAGSGAGNGTAITCQGKWSRTRA